MKILLLHIFCILILGLSSCSNNQFNSPNYQVYLTKTASEENFSRKLKLVIKTKNSETKGIIKQNSSISGGYELRDGNLKAFYFKLVLISSEGFEIYFIAEEKLATDKKSAIKTVTVFFPFSKITTKKIFNEYQITGQFEQPSTNPKP